MKPPMSKPPESPAALALVDDHPVLLNGLAGLIEESGDLTVVGCAPTLDEGRALLSERGETLDLMIVDLSLPDGSGLELVKDVETRELPMKTLVLSRHEGELYGLRVLRAGAQGFVHKRGNPDRILQAARKVLAGELVAPHGLMDQALRHCAGDSTEDHPLSELSDRELEVLEMTGHGKSPSAIADDLHLSSKTIHTYRGRIKEKLGLESSAALMRAAVRFVEGDL